MPNIRIALRAACGAALLAAGLVSPAAAVPYAFTNIIDSMIDPTIHGGEGVALDGSTIAIHTGAAIFTMNGGVRTNIAHIGASTPVGTIEYFDMFGEVSLSEGNVAFSARLTNIQTVAFRHSGGSLTAIAKDGDTTAEGTIRAIPSMGWSAISGNRVVFTASVSQPGLGPSSGIYVGAGSDLTNVVTDYDSAPSGTFRPFVIGKPAISGDRVAFRGTWDFDGEGLFTSQGGVRTTIAKVGDMTAAGVIRRVGSPDISGDTVAFNASLIGGGDAIFTGNGGTLTTIVKPGDPGPFGPFFGGTPGGVARNGQQVSFLARWTGDGQGAFVSNRGVISTVIKGGDSLFGQQLVYVLGRVVLDSSGSGRVAFGYVLANGVRGIALATPVPESGSAVMIACSCSLLAATRRTRRRS
jgi:hypothetical protein